MRVVNNNANSRWKNTLVFICGVLMGVMSSFETSFADTSGSRSIKDQVPIIKVVNANKSCLQPSCTISNAGKLCKCGVNLGYGICSSSGKMCNQCKECSHIDPLNDDLPQTLAPDS